MTTISSDKSGANRYNSSSLSTNLLNPYYSRPNEHLNDPKYYIKRYISEILYQSARLIEALKDLHTTIKPSTVYSIKKPKLYGRLNTVVTTWIE